MFIIQLFKEETGIGVLGKNKIKTKGRREGGQEEGKGGRGGKKGKEKRIILRGKTLDTLT